MSFLKLPETGQSLCDWLNSLKNIRNAQPIKLRLFFGGKEPIECDGALYEDLPVATEGSQAAREPDKYPCLWGQRIYALFDWGALMAKPLKRKHMKSKMCWKFCLGDEPFQKQADQRDWYCAGWSPSQPIPDEFKHAHPFGSWVGFHPWEVPSGELIDKYEDKPYARYEMRVVKV